MFSKIARMKWGVVLFPFVSLINKRYRKVTFWKSKKDVEK